MNGRKRHILVDTQGLLMKVKVHEAGLHDSAGAKLVMEGLRERFPRMAKVWSDSAYRGLKGWMRTTLGWELEVVRHQWTGVWVVSGQKPSESSEGVCGVASALGGGAYLRLAVAQSKTVEGL